MQKLFFSLILFLSCRVTCPSELALPNEVGVDSPDMITSLARMSFNGTSIVGIGFASGMLLFPQVRPRYREFFKRFIQNAANQSEPTAFVGFTTPQFLVSQSDSFTPELQPALTAVGTFYKLANFARRINPDDPAMKNVHFKLTPGPHMPREQQYITQSNRNITDFFWFHLCSEVFGTKIEGADELDAAIQRAGRKKIFKENHPLFIALAKIMQEDTIATSGVYPTSTAEKPYKVRDLMEDAQKTRAELVAFAREHKADAAFYKAIQGIIIEFEHYYNEILPFFQSVCGTDFNITLGQWVIRLIIQKKSFYKAAQILATMACNYPAVFELRNALFLLKLSKEFKQICYVETSLVSQRRMCKFLREFGAQGELHAPDAQFGQKINFTPVSSEVLDLFGLRPDLLLGTGQLVAPHTVEAPTLNTELVSCTHCSHLTQRYRLYAYTHTKSFCSVPCCGESLCSHELRALLESKGARGTATELIKNTILALYFTAGMHAHSSCYDDSFFYTLDHALIAEGLQALNANVRSVDLLKSIGISLDTVIHFYRTYAQAKKVHVRKITKLLATLQDEQALDTFIRPPFNDLLTELQQEAEFGEESLDLLFNSGLVGPLYLELYNVLAERFSFSEADMQDLIVQYARKNSSGQTDAQEKSVASNANTVALISPIESDEESEELDLSGTAPSLLAKAPQLVARERKKNYHTLHCLFAQRIPYELTLYRVTKNRTPEERAKLDAILGSIRDSQFRMDPRVWAPFDSLDALQGESYQVGHNAFGSLCVVSDTIPALVREKCNIDHLFDRRVDQLLTYGIVEIDGKIVRISIPGEIRVEGKLQVVLFQYTFDEKQVCYHRCHVNFDSNSTQQTNFVTPRVRKALYDYLRDKYANSDEHGQIISKLSLLVETESKAAK